MTRPLLTVLTSPIPARIARAYAGVRRAAGTIVRPHKQRPLPNRYPGHYALVRSVVEGLREIGADFNFNPSSIGDVGLVVYAPANEALQQAVELKRSGRISALIAGPTNAFLPEEHDGILLTREIDVVIVASEWVRTLYTSEAPCLAAKLRICQSGIDADSWRPSAPQPGHRALVYCKDAPDPLCRDTQRVLTALGFECSVVRYGSYDAETFKALLDDSSVAVFLSTFETQGLALAEAWAMDVPTLVWNPQTSTCWEGGRVFTAGSSAPFLTAATGRAWKTLEELAAATRDLMASADSLSPRAWVLANMTDAICARGLYGIVQDAARGCAASAPTYGTAL